MINRSIFSASAVPQIYFVLERSSSAGAEGNAAAVARPPPSSPPSEGEPVAPGLTPATGSSFLLAAGEQLTVTSESAQKIASPNIGGAMLARIGNK
jgi:hypothetical protein